VSLDIKLVASNASGPTYPLQASTASPSSEYKLIGGGCAASHVRDEAPPSFAHALIMYSSKPSGDSWQYAAGVPPKVNVQLSSDDVDPADDMKGWSCAGSGPYSTLDAGALGMPTTVTAHVVACRLQGPGKLESRLFTGPVNATAGNIGHYPSSQAKVEQGYSLTGGGCAVTATTKLIPGVGTPAPEYMVRSNPVFPLTSKTPALNDTWECKGGDPPFWPNPANAQAFAIGLRVAEPKI